MGTCCDSRPKSAFNPPSPEKPLKKRGKGRKNVLNDAISPTISSKTVSTPTLKVITALPREILAVLRSEGGLYEQKDYGEEEVMGYCEVSLCGKALEKQECVLVMSSYSGYLLTGNMRFVRKWDILEVLLITMQSNRSGAVLHSQDGDVWIEMKGLDDLLTIIESCFHTKRNRYIPCTTCPDSSSLASLYNQRSAENLVSYHSPEYQEITRVIIEHGQIGENRLFFRRTNSCSSAYPVLKVIFVLITSLRLYILSEDYTVKVIVLTADIWEVAVAEDESCQMMTAGGESHLFYLDKGFRRVMEEVVVRKGGTVRVKTRQEIEGRFRKSTNRGEV